MVYIRKRLTALLMVTLFLMCSCAIGVDDFESYLESDVTSSVESSEEDPFSDQTFYIATKAVIITTDKTEYRMDERIKLVYRAENEGEGFYFYPDYSYDGAFVQYWDGSEWQKCEKIFAMYEDWWEGRYGGIPEFGATFLLSDRADEGKEKYRVGMHFTCGTFYSNEFTIIE